MTTPLTSAQRSEQSVARGELPGRHRRHSDRRAFERADWRFATGFWVWSFLAVPAPIAEQLIACNPDAFVDHMLVEWAGAGSVFPDAVAAELENFLART